MDSFLERATLIKNELFFRYFSRISLNVLEDFFHRTPPSIFAVMVNRLYRVFYDVNNKINHEKP